MEKGSNKVIYFPFQPNLKYICFPLFFGPLKPISLYQALPNCLLGRGAAGSPAAVDLRVGARRRRRRLGPVPVHQRHAPRRRHVRLHLPGTELGLGRALPLGRSHLFSENWWEMLGKCEIFIMEVSGSEGLIRDGGLINRNQ